MYDSLSNDYDRFVNWQNRLAVELPFIIQQLQSINTSRVLDAATGTGMHAIALAKLGYMTTGADISRGMIDRARSNALSAAVHVEFKLAGFGSLAQAFGPHSFDAILCLGNSLPHLLSLPELSATLLDFASCLHSGGLLLIQNRNFDAVIAHHDRWMEPQSYSEDETEWIFQRFYDFDPDGLLTFNMVTLKKIAPEHWSPQVAVSRLRPLLQKELISCIAKAGFVDITSYGNMSGASFDLETSPNLIILARLPT